MPMLTVADAEPEDLEEIRALLREAGLNDDGVDGCLAGFIVAREGPRLIATACLEDCGAAGLLRSVAVVPDRRRRGLAAGLVLTLLGRSASKGHGAVYLLTSTAQGYFERFGSTHIERSQVSPAVQETGQFRSQVCASSAVMVREPGRAAAREA